MPEQLRLPDLPLYPDLRPKPQVWLWTPAGPASPHCRHFLALAPDFGHEGAASLPHTADNPQLEVYNPISAPTEPASGADEDRPNSLALMPDFGHESAAPPPKPWVEPQFAVCSLISAPTPPHSHESSGFAENGDPNRVIKRPILRSVIWRCSTPLLSAPCGSYSSARGLRV